MNSRATVFFIFILLSAAPSMAQSTVGSRITGAVDEHELVRLAGTVHSLAQPQNDVGPVADSFFISRMLLLLQRPAEREADLRTFLHDSQNRRSASYHRWITPQQFGERFGAADADIQIVTTWLQSHGFKVGRITSSKSLIEFSGTAAQLRDAFQTDIHQYTINGKTHYANTDEVRIPKSLAAVVRGISPLHDFRATPLVRNIGPATYSPSKKTTRVQWTIPNPNGSGNFYALAPEDFATQYDLTPLYQSGVNGTGQIIGIINESNIDVSLVNGFRQLFNLSASQPQVVIDGSDPGGSFPSNVEAFLDVEVSGAVAPQATINLYISDGGTLFDPLVFAALRAIEDDQAGVLSVSFSSCEQNLQNGNEIFASLWQQAAAQGQTVLVSAGDSGSAGCDPAGFQVATKGLAVNGIASTPWNVAVGGTDFYYSDYASGAPSAASLWQQTNNSSNGSLIAPLPEQVWNDANGFNVNSWGVANDIAGGGGASNCAISSNFCAGYPKPNWQTGPGVPSDGVRDLPDVSLFAADGLNLSAYPICVLPGDCVTNGSGQVPVFLVGGTSASAPAMAGIMALINQKYGRQGQANVVLYPLAQQMPSAFHDITLGGNDVPIFTSSQYYFATPGYDQASGLGSVDAKVLVDNWRLIHFLPTTTTLTLSSATITHGQPVTVSTAVMPASGSGTPSGNVAILTDSSLPSNRSQLFLALTNGTASGSINSFPGGTYHVFANYGGDDVFGMSKSSPVVLAVGAERANLNFAAVVAQPSSTPAAIASGGTVPYGALLTLGIQPTGVSAASGTTNGVATGTATFSVDSNTNTVPLDSTGLAVWAVPTLALGSHTAGASYSGDSSFGAGTASQLSFVVAKAQPVVSFQLPDLLGLLGNVALRTGDSTTISVAVTAPFPGIGAPPTGTVTVSLGSLVQTIALSVINNYESTALVTFSNLTAQCYSFPSASYSGDSNWLPAGNGIDGSLCVSPGTNAPTTTTLTVTPGSISGSQTATFTATVSPPSSSATSPTGFVSFFDNGALLFNQLFPSSSSSGGSSTVQVSGIYPSEFLTNGANQITAVYSGDCCYSPSSSAPANIMAVSNSPDFTLTPQVPQILIKAGGSGNVGLNVSSLAGFNGIVDLTCIPSSTNLTCGLTPASLTVNGVASATIHINVLSATSQSSLARSTTHFHVAGFVTLACICLGGSGRRKWTVICGFALMALLLFIASCGGGGQQTFQSPPPTAPNTSYYTVLVSATGNGVIHNSQITVAVQ